MFNETIPSFVWLFESFLQAMPGKQPSTIFTDQDATMATTIAHVFPNTAHCLCLWHIGQNAVKHLGPIIKAAEDEVEDKSGNKFWVEFKSCIYEDRAEIYFTEKWNGLLAKYNLKGNSWMSNLYALRAKWAAVHRDSFTADMHSTQRSEGMNNVFKKRFRRKLGLSEFLLECENVVVDLRSNEKDADFESRRKIPVCYIPNLPMLKTAAETYTRRIYSEFEEEFKKQFTLTSDLLEANGINSTFFVKYMQSDRGATVVLNNKDSTIIVGCLNA
jgi:zinc finger SWIM domain-containing protein 3